MSIQSLIVLHHVEYRMVDALVASDVSCSLTVSIIANQKSIGDQKILQEEPPYT